MRLLSDVARRTVLGGAETIHQAIFAGRSNIALHPTAAPLSVSGRG
jgi:hypothetical protein